MQTSYLTVQSLLEQIEVGEKLKQETAESKEDFEERRDNHYKILNKNLDTLLKGLLQNSLLLDNYTLTHAEINGLFRYFAQTNPQKFKELCRQYPEEIKTAVGTTFAQHFIKEIETDVIDAALIAMANFNKSLDSFNRDLFLLSQPKNIEDEDEYEYSSHNKSQEKDEYLYDEAVREIHKFKIAFPKIEIEKHMQKRYAMIEKKSASVKMNVELIQKNIQIEIETLINKAQEKIPSIKVSSDASKAVLWYILQKGEAAIRSNTYINNDPELQDIFLQLRALSQVRDSIATENIKSILITTENVKEKIVNESFYKETGNAEKYKKPLRFLHIASLILVVTIPLAIHSQLKHHTMFYASKAEKKAAQPKKFAKKIQDIAQENDTHHTKKFRR